MNINLRSGTYHMGKSEYLEVYDSNVTRVDPLTNEPLTQEAGIPGADSFAAADVGIKANYILFGVVGAFLLFGFIAGSKK